MDAPTSAPSARGGSGRPPGAPRPVGPAAPSVVGRLGRYRLLQVIGGGGMGVVHLGLDPDGRAVAIKVMRPHVAADPSARSRLAREVDALRRVRSPRVAEVLDADPDAEQPYVVTEFVPAPPLDAFVEREGPMSGAALGRLGLGLGDALAAIHAAGVVHRDLKPGNVLITDTDPVVIDFGIAQVADDVRLTSAGLVMGTPGYLSPEVLEGGGSLTGSGDWWGWAATLAFAATGRPPFGGGPVEAVLSRVRRGDAHLQGAPPALAAVLAAALAPDPADRPPPRALRQAAQALVDGADGADDGWALPRTAPGGASRPSRTAPVPHRPQSPTASTAVTPSSGRSRFPGPAAAGASAAGTVQLPETAAPVRDAPPEASPVPVRVPWPEPAPAAGRPRTADRAIDRTTDRTTDRTRALPADGREDVGPRALAGPPEAALTQQQPVQPPQPAPLPPQQEANPYAPFEGGSAPERGRPTTGAVLLLLLLVVVALGAVAPLVAAMVVAGGVVLARTVDRTVAAVVRRRYERGPRASDGARAAVTVPGNLLVAALVSVPALLLPAAMALSTAFLVGWAVAPQDAPVPGRALPLAAAVLVGQATAWWGPGGRSVRRGTRTAVRGALPGRTGGLVTTAVLALVLVACVLVVVNSGGTPDWTPLTAAPPGLG